MTTAPDAPPPADDVRPTAPRNAAERLAVALGTSRPVPTPDPGDETPRRG